MDIKAFKKQLLKDWGKRCKDYSTGCYGCSVWHAYDILVSAYDTKEALHKQNWTSRNNE